MTWHSDAPPPVVTRAPGHWVRVLWRGGRIVAVIGAGVFATLFVRPVERRLHGLARPWTQPITVWACGRVFAILGIAYDLEGTPLDGPGAVVANHVSWLDIFALNARKRVYFVAKAEVAGWPGIGLLARLVGTVFIRRDPREARAQTAMLAGRLGVGHRLLFFPEGSSTDGLRVLPFKTTLFQALHGLGEGGVRVQPVTLLYEAPEGQDARFYGWWGDMELGAHLSQVLGARRQGRVRVVCHAPLAVSDFPDRKALALACERAVRAGMGAQPASGVV
ncbi:lysophospholipid acyltransferase family protein [Roseovarius autotrophicus]|uniref:lysophospholipid acyltransferase family protein n=1 Tax=Roseovarius autotrophicus TaxID=2824121 RepID=UPI0019F67E3D|nr:lysophospholipid acyltransferase family protein [Roseovarius autotrophicus]MBE0455144.1 1-acyl-sn-glycerol-3-phosphate acyltransferase [Roseovarius sp.]